MSIEVSKDQKFVYTVGADHLLVKYRLWDLVSRFLSSVEVKLG
jgi:hypothetical protein